MGLKYPIISSENEQVIGYRFITKVFSIENCAMDAISLDITTTDRLIAIPYSERKSIIDMQEELSKLTEILPKI